MPRDIRNLDEAIEEISRIAVQTSQGAYVRVEDVKRLLEEKRDVLEAELKDKPPVPFRMTPERARRLAMRDEQLREAHRPGGPREPGRSIPAGPIASEGVKS